MKIHASLAFSLCLASLALSQNSVKDGDGAVRNDRATIEKGGRWIYNDIDAAFAKAKETGKPLMVVVRCVPCVSCMELDGDVVELKGGLEPLADQFICARIINANSFDLSLFQFDYDVSFAAMFFNGDRTIYGRFGTRTVKDSRAKDVTLEGFKKSLEGALEVHRGYPANKAALAGKQGPPKAAKTAMDYPSLNEKFKPELDWAGKVMGSCVHCHMLRNGERKTLRSNGTPLPESLVYPSPLPESIGLTLNRDERAQVTGVAPSSPAQAAGFQAGDTISAFEGQPLVSIADVQWVLDRAPSAGTLKASIIREGKPKDLSIALPKGWRSKQDISWRTSTWGMRVMIGGLESADLNDETRTQRGLKKDDMALLIKFLGQFGPSAGAKNAGFKVQDVITEMDGKTTRITESAMLAYLIQTKKPGEKVKVAVLRGGQRVELMLPMQ